MRLGTRQAWQAWLRREIVAVTTDRRAVVSWAELEVPLVARRAQVSWAELQIPTGPEQRVVVVGDGIFGLGPTRRLHR